MVLQVMTQEKLEERVDAWFTYHSPSVDQVDKMQEIRREAYSLAILISEVEDMDPADKMTAIRKLREAIMAANAGIVCYQEPEPPIPEDAPLTTEEMIAAGKRLAEELKYKYGQPYVPPKASPPCSDCSGPVWIAGPWTCPSCGRHFSCGTLSR